MTVMTAEAEHVLRPGMCVHRANETLLPPEERSYGAVLPRGARSTVPTTEPIDRDRMVVVGWFGGDDNWEYISDLVAVTVRG